MDRIKMIFESEIFPLIRELNDHYSQFIDSHPDGYMYNLLAFGRMSRDAYERLDFDTNDLWYIKRMKSQIESLTDTPKFKLLQPKNSTLTCEDWQRINFVVNSINHSLDLVLDIYKS